MTLTRRLSIAWLAWFGLIGANGMAADDLPLLFRDQFEEGAVHWEPTDAAAWKVVPSDSRNIYSHFQQSDYRPPYRSPVNFALLKDVVVGDFRFEARLRSTVKDYDHRDMCFVFGYRDVAHFYYVHLGKKTGDHANQVFIVNGAPRTKISTRTSTGTNWDDEWHNLRVVRRVSDGAIDVYFDDMENAVMSATDRTFMSGRIGIGSFDDTGDWDDVRLYGSQVNK